MTLLQVSAPKDEDFSDLKQVAQADWFQKAFGKAVFISKTKPQTPVMIDRLQGTLTHQRKKYWVIRKPGRQQGDAPKVERKYRLPVELAEAIEARAAADRCNQVDVVEAALAAYLAK